MSMLAEPLLGVGLAVVGALLHKFGGGFLTNLVTVNRVLGDSGGAARARFMFHAVSLAAALTTLTGIGLGAHSILRNF